VTERSISTTLPCDTSILDGKRVQKTRTIGRSIVHFNIRANCRGILKALQRQNLTQTLTTLTRFIDAGMSSASVAHQDS